jgi:pyrimidine-nucleoside phosphorylase
MRNQEDAVQLARLLVETGEQMGKRTAALVTDMDQPLGRAVGNSLEILECIEVMRGDHHPMSADLRELSLELSAWMFYLAGRTPTLVEGRRLADEMLASGKALAKFREMLRLQGGGDISVVDKPSRLPQAAHTRELLARSTGYVTAVQCEQVGIASLLLGGGRSTKEDVIDHAVGIILHRKVGDRVFFNDPLCTIHYNADTCLQEVVEILQSSYTIEAEPPRVHRPLICAVIDQQEQLPAPSCQPPVVRGGS